MVNKLAVFAGLLAAVAVNAQDTSGISQCILGCVTDAASGNGCTSFADLQCVCTNTAFQQASLSCLQSNCTSDDVQSAEALQQQQCAAITASGSSSGTSETGTSAGASTTEGTSASTSRSESASSATATTPRSSTSGTVSRSASASGSTASASNTGNAAAPGMLISGPGAALGMVVGVAGVVAGGFLAL